MVTGRKPYIADTPMAVVLKQMTDPLPLPTEFVPDLPEGVEHILLNALAKEPENRYPDMNALIAAMEGVLAETQKVEVSASIQQEIKTETLGGKFSPKMIMAVVGALGIILVLVFGIPWAQGKFFAAPEATPTRTPVPSATREIRPLPTATLSDAALTAEALDDLSKTVLAYFAAQPPTFEDDFSAPDMVWGETSEGLAIVDLVDGGVLTITDHAEDTGDDGLGPDHAIPGTTFPTNELLAARDFALQFDFNFESDLVVDSVSIQFRALEFSIDYNETWTLFDTSNSEKVRITGGKTNLQSQNNTLLIVQYIENLGIYLNNTLLYSKDDIPPTDGVNRILVLGDHGSSMDFDNFKFWSLDG
jgi:hypothetical protein